MSPTRRLLLVGVLVVAGALLYSVAVRREASSATTTAGGDFGVCATQRGDAARACYKREAGRELATVGAEAVAVTLVAPAGTGEVTFASVEARAEAAQQPLLCDLHTRVGVIDEQVPSWLGWTEPLAPAAPVS